MTTPKKKRHAGLPSLSVSPPRMPDLYLASNAKQEAEEQAKLGTPILDRPFSLPMSAGKADPEPPRKTLFRPR